MNLTDEQILNLIKLLKDEILKNKDEIKKFPNEHIILDDWLVNELMDYFLEHASELIDILSYIDFSNASLVNRKVSFVDLSLFFNIPCDPQTIYDRDLTGTKLCGDFAGKIFDNVKCVATDFSKAKNVNLNPQEIANKNLVRSILCGIDLRNTNIDNVILENADLKGAIISERIKLQLNGQHVLGLENAIIEYEPHLPYLEDKYEYCKDKIKNLMLPF